MDAETLREVPGSEDVHRIGGYRGRRRRRLGQGPPVRPPESERAVGLSIDLVALLAHRTVVPAAEQGEVRERRRPPLRPVAADVMALPEPDPAAREATAPVAVLEGPSQRRRDRAGTGSDLHNAPIGVVPYHHAAGIARQTLGRSSWNARTVLEDGLARRPRVRQHLGIDVDHDLVALPRGTGIEPMMQGRLREQGQRVRLLLDDGGRFYGNVPRAGASVIAHFPRRAS